ncbi:MAG: hypothetical protein HZA04_06335 [Nitrospinae bacterium]|nr:hypothetical protein [Nitrospinota bacterium]
MSFVVSVKCPECGAPGKHAEGVITFKCQYCASVLRAQGEGIALKYVIPARIKKEDVPLAVKRAVVCGKAADVSTIRGIFTVCKPFWYFKGMVFFARAGEMWDDDADKPKEGVPATALVPVADVVAKTWSHTIPANPTIAPALFSLGIQPEALTLEPYDSEQYAAYRVAPITASLEDAEKAVVKAALNNVNLDRKKYRYSSINFIGEKFFIIYYPLTAAVCEGKGGFSTLFFDGVNGNFIEAVPGKDVAAGLPPDASHYHLQVITHRCPNCGHDLEPGDFNIAFYCRVCFSQWLLEKNQYVGIAKRTLESQGGQNTVYVPFWRFDVRLVSRETGTVCGTVGEFKKLMKAGDLTLRGQDPARPLRFYIPALSAKNATVVLKLSARINMAQKDLPVADVNEFSHPFFYGVTLPQSEAEEMLPVVVFAVIGRHDRAATEFYRSMKVEAQNAELVWYPFEDKGTMLADRFFQFHLPKRGMTAAI